jgi:hypothetical protein
MCDVHTIVFYTESRNRNIIENLLHFETSKYITPRWNVIVFKNVMSYILVDTRICQRLRNPLPEYSHSHILTVLRCLIELISFNSDGCQICWENGPKCEIGVKLKVDYCKFESMNLRFQCQNL